MGHKKEETHRIQIDIIELEFSAFKRSSQSDLNRVAREAR